VEKSKYGSVDNTYSKKLCNQSWRLLEKLDLIKSSFYLFNADIRKYLAISRLNGRLSKGTILNLLKDGMCSIG